MAVDYDLVVVGNNAAARWAAIAAKERSARVAFISVEPEVIPYPLILGQLSQSRALKGCSLQARAEASLMNWQSAHSPGQLANLGIEQINGAAHFHQKPQLQVQVGDRMLQSRRYLLSLNTELRPPDIPGLQVDDWVFPAKIFQYLDELNQELPHPTLVVGEGPVAIILSQALARLGYPVILISECSRILPWEDAEAAFRIQAHLEADGVQIFTRCQIKESSPKSQFFYQIVTNCGELSVSQLVWAVEPTSSAINSNLVTVDLQHHSQGLWTNARLQTSSPRIYACGSVLGGYTLADIAYYEAIVAVKNALSRQQSNADYQTVPWSIPTVPPLARVGFTEQQAQQYQRPYRTIYQTFDDTLLGRVQGSAAGWSKFIVQTDGQILGAHVIGPAASEIIHGVALTMKQRCPLVELADYETFQSSYARIVGQAARQWSSQ